MDLGLVIDLTALGSWLGVEPINLLMNFQPLLLIINYLNFLKRNNNYLFLLSSRRASGLSVACSPIWFSFLLFLSDLTLQSIMHLEKNCIQWRVPLESSWYLRCIPFCQRVAGGVLLRWSYQKVLNTWDILRIGDERVVKSSFSLFSSLHSASHCYCISL